MDNTAEEELSVSFGLQVKVHDDEIRVTQKGFSKKLPELPKPKPSRTGSFSCLSGAALGANATLANTPLANGRIGQQILPGLDSPRAFRLLGRSPSLSQIEPLIMASTSRPDYSSGRGGGRTASSSAPHRMESSSSCYLSFMLSASDAQTAGGAAGEDRVQAFCSEEDGWLVCAIYDGFNGRDAADFLAGTLYDNISASLVQLQWRRRRGRGGDEDGGGGSDEDDNEDEDEGFHERVLVALKKALVDAEAEFMEIVEEEVEKRVELAMVGSCVLVVLLHGNHLYTLNLGDSRAVLATRTCEGELAHVQLTQDHHVSNAAERERVAAEHPDDPAAAGLSGVKGKLKVTRAFGAGYLKKASLNDRLIGMLRVRELSSPPYISSKPHVSARRVSAGDEFVVIASDGLFDFFSNEEVVRLLHAASPRPPHPARFLLDQLLVKAARRAGITLEYLKNIPIGRKRKYHDDITIIVVTLGAINDRHCRTSSASTNNS